MDKSTHVTRGILTHQKTRKLRLSILLVLVFFAIILIGSGCKAKEDQNQTTTEVQTTTEAPVIEGYEGEPAVIAVFKNTDEGLKWAFAYTSGALLTDYDFTDISPLTHEGLYRAYGPDGAKLVDTVAFIEEAKKSEPTPELFDQKAIIFTALEPDFEAQLSDYVANEDRFIVAFYDDATQSYGYKKGNAVIIPAQFTLALDFIDGYAVAQTGEWGEGQVVINEEGTVVFTSKSSLTNLSKGYIGELPDPYSYMAEYLPKVIYKADGTPVFTDTSIHKFYDFIPFQNKNKDLFFVCDGQRGYVIDDKGNEVKGFSSIENYSTFSRYSSVIMAEGSFGGYTRRAYYGINGQELWVGSEPPLISQDMPLPDHIVVNYKEPVVNRFMRYDQLQVEVKGNQKATDDINALLIQDTSAITGEFDPEFPSTSDISHHIEAHGNIVTVVSSQYFYGIGAAHGNYGQTYSHYDLLSSKWINLSDLFKNPESAYIRLENVIYQQMLDDYEEGSFWTENGFYLGPDRSFAFTDKGISIIYQQYEIAAYAMGMPTFEIPYLELEGYLNQDQPFVSELIKDAFQKLDAAQLPRIQDYFNYVAKTFNEAAWGHAGDALTEAGFIESGSPVGQFWQWQFETWRNEALVHIEFSPIQVDRVKVQKYESGELLVAIPITLSLKYSEGAEQVADHTYYLLMDTEGPMAINKTLVDSLRAFSIME